MAKFPCSVDKNIFQRGETSFRVKMMSAGRTINKTFDTLTEAQVYRDLIKANAALDPNEERIYEARAKKAESKTFTLAHAITKYRQEKTAKKKGADKEKSLLNKISRCTAIVSMPLYQIKDSHILQLLEWIRTSGNLKSKRVTSESTQRRYFNTIRHIFQIAVDEWKKIETNPCSAVAKSARPKDGKGRDRRLRGDEYELILRQLSGQAKIMVILAVETAMRRGEQFNMRWEHLDLKKRSLNIPDTKTGAARTISLSLAAVEAFKSLGVVGIKGKIISITPAQLRYAWKQARETIGSPDLRIHDLRHEATSRLFEKGFGEMAASQQTGHKTMAMMKKYAHLNQTHILELLDRPIRAAE
jgi:integrase